MIKVRNFFRQAAFVTGIQKRSGKALLDYSLKKLRQDIDAHNLAGTDWRSKATDKIESIFGMKSLPLPVLHPIEMLINERTALEAHGVFVFGNSITNLGDEFEFKVCVEQIKGGDEQCTLYMPHHPFPREISSGFGRFDMVAFLTGEAKDRTGFEASLEANGLPPPPPNFDDV